VVLSSGQFTFGLPLLSVSSLGGMQWGFALDYLPDNDIDGILGLNFNFSQNLRLEQNGSTVSLLTGHNTKEDWTLSGGVYVPAADNNSQATLEKSGSGASEIFTLRGNDGTETVFFGFDAAITTKGRPQTITDRYGSQFSYTWTQNGGLDQVTSVTDSYGRTGV